MFLIIFFSFSFKRALNNKQFTHSKFMSIRCHEFRRNNFLNVACKLIMHSDYQNQITKKKCFSHNLVYHKTTIFLIRLKKQIKIIITNANHIRQLNCSDYLENFKLPTHTVYTQILDAKVFDPLVENFCWIHDALWVKCIFDLSHHLYPCLSNFL